MESDNPMQTVSFLLTCVEGPQCLVAFEPWGAVHTLKRDDRFTVRLRGRSIEPFEISYKPGVIIVGLGDDSELTVTNLAGEVLPT